MSPALPPANVRRNRDRQRSSCPRGSCTTETVRIERCQRSAGHRATGPGFWCRQRRPRPGRYERRCFEPAARRTNPTPNRKSLEVFASALQRRQSIAVAVQTQQRVYQWLTQNPFAMPPWTWLEFSRNGTYAVRLLAKVPALRSRCIFFVFNERKVWRDFKTS